MVPAKELYDDLIERGICEVAAERGGSRSLKLTGTPGPWSITEYEFDYLTHLARGNRVRRAIQIGTGFGVSAVALAQGIWPDGLLVTIDDSSEHRQEQDRRDDIADQLLRNTRCHAQIFPTTDSSPKILPGLAQFGPYDLAFIDGSHEPEDIIDDVTGVAAMMRHCGTILVHDSDRLDAGDLNVLLRACGVGPFQALRQPECGFATQAWVVYHTDERLRAGETALRRLMKCQ